MCSDSRRLSPIQFKPPARRDSARPLVEWRRVGRCELATEYRRYSVWTYLTDADDALAVDARSALRQVDGPPPPPPPPPPVSPSPTDWPGARAGVPRRSSSTFSSGHRPSTSALSPSPAAAAAAAGPAAAAAVDHGGRGGGGGVIPSILQRIRRSGPAPAWPPPAASVAWPGHKKAHR